MMQKRQRSRSTPSRGVYSLDLDQLQNDAALQPSRQTRWFDRLHIGWFGGVQISRRAKP